jgi:DNA-binding response OmpR family regulator
MGEAMATTTILVVEDEILVGEEIREDLERAGYCVPDVVTSGDEVLNSVSRYKSDLILMDVRLEGEIDGIEAAQQIKAIQNIPIIFLTAYSDPVTLTRAADTSPSAYLLKPFSIRELTANVSMALAKSQKKQSDELSHTGPILNALDIPAFLLDSNGRVQQANPAVLSLLNVDGLARVQGESSLITSGLK